MIVKRLLAWLETADSARRAQAAAFLARAFLLDGLEHADLMDAETAMTSLLDDPSIEVRKAMARILAMSPDAPAHIISALSSDHSSISARVLTHSPLLTDDDLIDALGVADSYAQVAVAIRPGLSAKVAGMLAENGSREAMIALAVNDTAALSDTAMTRIIERHGTDGEVREALLGRDGLPAIVRAAIVSETARSLRAFVTRTGWLSEQRSERCCKDGRDTATIEIASGERTARSALPVALANRLRDARELTPSLLLRALVSGERSLFTAALATLAGLDQNRVAGLVKAWSGAGFGALYAKAGLPASLLGAFRAALAAQDATGLIYEPGQRPQLSGMLIDRTLRACEANASPELRKVSALLHRLRAEAARTEARQSNLAKATAIAAQAQANAAPTIQVDLAAIEAEIASAPKIMAA